jgi:glycosyltransferase involved in cell wall biosynthesis
MDEAMKILVVTQSFFPDVDGGSGRFVFELSRRLRGKGHDITLIGERAACRAPAAKLDGMRVLRYGSPLLGLFLPWTFTSPLLVHDLASGLSRADRFDLVWCHHYSPGLGGLLFARQKGVPGLFTYHASRYIEWSMRAGQPRRFNSPASRLLLRWWADRVYSGAALRIERKCLHMASLITVLSDFSKRQIEGMHPREAGKVLVIPGGVDTERFVPVSDVKRVRRRLGLPEDGFLVLTVRRLIARMGLENLVDAMQTVVRSEPDAHLLIGGRGYLLESLRKRVDRAGLGKSVRLLGYIDDGLLPEYYAASDLFVLPTISLEGFGMVTLEALSCGRPVLGTNAGATPEILKGLDEDLILERVDPEHIADAILRHKNKCLDPEMRSRCRRYVEQRYSWAAVTDRVEETMAELAGRGHD